MYNTGSMPCGGNNNSSKNLAMDCETMYVTTMGRLHVTMTLTKYDLKVWLLIVLFVDQFFHEALGLEYFQPVPHLYFRSNPWIALALVLSLHIVVLIQSLTLEFGLIMFPATAAPRFLTDVA